MHGPGKLIKYRLCINTSPVSMIVLYQYNSGWMKFPNGKVRPGDWKDDQLVRWTGPEQFEAQMKARKLLKR